MGFPNPRHRTFFQTVRGVPHLGLGLGKRRMPGFTLKVQELKVGIRYLKVGMHMAYEAYVYISWYTNDILLLITYNLTKEYKLGLDLCIGSCSQNT